MIIGEDGRERKVDGMMPRADAAYLTRPIADRKRSHRFSCVASAFGNALIELGFPIRASELNKLHKEANVPGENYGGRWLTEEKGARTLDAVRALVKRMGWPVEIRRYKPSQTLPSTVAKIRRGGFAHAILSLRTPNHAVALNAAGETPLIIDNGGWKSGKPSWLGRNVKAVIAIRRKPAKSQPKPLAVRRDLKSEIERRRLADTARRKADGTLAHIRPAYGEPAICGDGWTSGALFVRVDSPNRRFFANCFDCLALDAGLELDAAS